MPLRGVLIKNMKNINGMKKNLILLKVYLLAGTFTFSGGMAMLPLIERDICEKYKLLDKKELYEYSTLSQTLPGVIAITNACFVGKKINGLSGMFFASLGAIFPAYFFMLIATILFHIIPKEGPVTYALTAVRAASSSFLFAAAFTISKYNLKTKTNQIIAISCFFLTIFNLLGAPVLIIGTALAGFLLSYAGKEKYG